MKDEIAQSTHALSGVQADRVTRDAGEVVERKGIEPSTFALRTRRSPS
jgi:hypothetical protein